MVDFAPHLKNRVDLDGAGCPKCSDAPLSAKSAISSTVVCAGCGHEMPRYRGRTPQDEADADQAEHYLEAGVSRPAEEVVSETANGQTSAASVTYRHDDVAAKGDPTIGRDLLPPRTLPPGASKVRISLGMTKNLGNFEYARMDVAIEDICEATPEARTACFDGIKGEARAMLSSLIARVDASIAGRRTP